MPSHMAEGGRSSPIMRISLSEMGALQQGGVIQMGTLTDALRQMDIGAYRKIWNR
jgi:hypothetical protein